MEKRRARADLISSDIVHIHGILRAIEKDRASCFAGDSTKKSVRQRDKELRSRGCNSFEYSNSHFHLNIQALITAFEFIKEWNLRSSCVESLSPNLTWVLKVHIIDT